jgi:hypothetical protein
MKFKVPTPTDLAAKIWEDDNGNCCGGGWLVKHIVPNGFNSVDWLGDLIRILDIDVREITELMNGNDDAETVEERIQNLIKWGSEHDIEFI